MLFKNHLYNINNQQLKFYKKNQYMKNYSYNSNNLECSKFLNNYLLIKKTLYNIYNWIKIYHNFDPHMSKYYQSNYYIIMKRDHIINNYKLNFIALNNNINLLICKIHYNQHILIHY